MGQPFLNDNSGSRPTALASWDWQNRQGAHARRAVDDKGAGRLRAANMPDGRRLGTLYSVRKC